MNWYIPFFATTIAPTVIVPLLWLAAALLARRGSRRVRQEYQLNAGVLDDLLDEAAKSEKLPSVAASKLKLSLAAAAASARLE